MENRRDFIRKAAALSGGLGLVNGLPASIQKAFAIDPAPGSTYLDAEHVVFLMQENRSFDHCFGTLQGVRGFNDPRAVTLPNQHKVWAQTNAAGDTYTPFRLNLKDSRITWLGSLPHSWDDMTAARNEGHHDQWLEAKKSGRKECAGMPLTMGYFDRNDIPFYYALADAFTVCDHHFCSSLTGTTPNRLHFWTGTIREKKDPDKIANVYNSDVSYDREANWKTFPEYLEDHGVAWKIYQNEVSIETGFEGEEEDWLANFTDNPIEWFTQFQIRFAHGHRAWLKQALDTLPRKIAALKEQLSKTAADDAQLPRLKRQLENLEKQYAYVQTAVTKYTDTAFDALPAREKSLHERAFADNRQDAHYRELESIIYEDNAVARNMNIPKGDVLHQFRQDVETGKLPTVSWIVAPSNFSDHPGSPWYGAWYLSEVIDILTKNPELWKKTIFILNYDENDGYFDHLPPFVPADPYRANSGKMSAGIDAKEEYVSKEQAWMQASEKRMAEQSEGPIGLGFRVPLVIASPWTRGGWVNSEVCDLTSPIQFLEHFLSHKTGKKIQTDAITAFRRSICGDLRSVFRPYTGEKLEAPTPVDRLPFLKSIHKAQFKDLPSGFKKLSAADIQALNENPFDASLKPVQEKGTRAACAIPYQIYADARWHNNALHLRFDNRKDVFGDRTAGAGFIVYNALQKDPPRNYVVIANDNILDEWQPNEDGRYHLRVHGVNGFFREFRGHQHSASLQVACEYATGNNRRELSGDLLLQLKNTGQEKIVVQLTDHSYGKAGQTKTLAPGKTLSLPWSLSGSQGWYDLSVQIQGDDSFDWRYAGHVETGRPGITDPLMGQVIG